MAILSRRRDIASSQPTGHITISIGVACYPVDATDQDTLVDCADSALYGSKRGGRNKTVQHTKVVPKKVA